MDLKILEIASDTENKKQELSDDLLAAEDEYQQANKELKEIILQLMLWNWQIKEWPNFVFDKQGRLIIHTE